jgi:hypothetical protein
MDKIEGINSMYKKPSNKSNTSNPLKLDQNHRINYDVDKNKR